MKAEIKDRLKYVFPISAKKMKILTISAYYPPFAYGGYENRVCDIMNGLALRGHLIRVLSSRPDQNLQVSPIKFSYPVDRRLHGASRVLGWANQLTLQSNSNRLGVALIFLHQVWRDLHDLRLIDQTIRKFKPDLIYLGHILPLSASLLPFFAAVSLPMVVDDGGKTLLLSYENRGLWYRFQTEFQSASSVLQFLKKAFTALVSVFSSHRLTRTWVWPIGINVFFNSHLNYRNFLSATVPINCSKVIHSGLDLQQFSFERKKDPLQPLSIIVPGRIEPSKGQLDAVKLSALLREAGIQHHMTIVGDRWNVKYAGQLEEQVRLLDLENCVSFLPMQEKRDLIELYHQSDICFFPSYHQTGFSRIPMEAMACGCVLLSYGNEGSDEIFHDGENGFITSLGDIENAKVIVMKLVNSPDLMAQIACNARLYMEQSHSMTAYVDQIEAFLSDALNVESTQ